MDHQVTQVLQVRGGSQEQPVSRGVVAGLELLGPQAKLEMALEEVLEQQEMLGTTDIQVMPAMSVGNFVFLCSFDNLYSNQIKYDFSHS